jgi:rubrerythrin
MKVNKLAEELTHEKSKHLKEVKSIARIQKDFDIQFEHERYYEDTQKINKNIIEGVKYQYNKMKRSNFVSMQCMKKRKSNMIAFLKIQLQLLSKN